MSESESPNQPQKQDSNFEDDNYWFALHEYRAKTKEHQIYLPPLQFTTLFTTAFHEIGHQIGRYLSFKDRQVLTPDQLRIETVELTSEELEYFKQRMSRDPNGKIKINSQPETYGQIHESIVKKIIDAYTKRNFDFNKVNIKGESLRQIKDRVKQGVEEGGINTLAKDQHGSIKSVNSKAGRNIEMDSHATEYAGAQILTNTLFRYGLLKPNEKLTMPLSTSASHRRAQRIVERAHKRKGWILPSGKDLGAQ